MDEIRIIKGSPQGVITPPPSKSLSHRAIICAALSGADWRSLVTPVHESDDIKATASAVEKLCGGDKPGSDLIDCGESGSTLRFLLPVAALRHRETIFTGRGRLLSRPLEPYGDVFEHAGVTLTQADGRIVIRGPLRPGRYRIQGHVSSQFITGLLLTLPLLSGDSSIELTTPLESKAYVDMTLDVMRRFGVSVEQSGYDVFEIEGNQNYTRAAYEVEPDYSQAAFFLAARALGCDVTCAGLDPLSKQGDRAIVDIIARMTANGRLDAISVDVSEIPDLFPVIVVLCAVAEGESHISGAGRLRLKESDRLRAMAEELTRLGADVCEGSDFLAIKGVPRLRGGKVYSHNDHRIAMAMAVASIRCENPVELHGAACVSKSYPGFWEDFEKRLS